MLLERAVELVVGFVAGVFAGLTGAGGGLLLVPILVFLGAPALVATATSNVAITVSAASGTWINTRRFALPWRRVALLAVPAVLLAPVGVVIASRLPERWLLVAFAVFNVAAIGLLQLKLRAGRTGGEEATEPIPPAGTPATADHPPAEGGSDTGTALPPASVPMAAATGAGGGVLAGLFGVGGGLVMVPLQALALATPVRLASRISLAVVLFASVSAVATHTLTGHEIHWVTAMVIAIGGLAGAPVGARWLHRLTDLQATRLIQVTMGCVAGYFLIRAFA